MKIHKEQKQIIDRAVKALDALSKENVALRNMLQQMQDEAGSMGLWVETLVKEKRELKLAIDEMMVYLGTTYECTANNCQGCKEDCYQAVMRGRKANENYRKDVLASDDEAQNAKDG